jgi:hypothetical protein
MDEDHPDHPSRDHDEEGSELSGPNMSTRLKTYIKPRIPSTQEVLDRRSRKNAQSRSRASKLRHRIVDIEHKQERNDEEQHIFNQYENRRKRKNDRSRERALEKKEEIDRILAKPEKKRTKIEKQFLETALSAKKRKNEGDRLRRSRLKDLGLSTKGTGLKPGISARGPLPPQYGMYPPHHHHMGMPMHPGDIPMSPLPTMPPHYAPYPHSPGTFASPGMMPNMGFSPHGRRPPPGTPGRHEHMPYMPPPQAYDTSSPGRQLPPSRVEQRRNPDGSMSIQIGGRGPEEAGPPFGGEVSRMPGADVMAEVSGMMNDNAYGEGEESSPPEGGGAQEENGE